MIEQLDEKIYKIFLDAGFIIIEPESSITIDYLRFRCNIRDNIHYQHIFTSLIAILKYPNIDKIILEESSEEFIMEWKMKGWEPTLPQYISYDTFKQLGE